MTTTHIPETISPDPKQQPMRRPLQIMAMEDDDNDDENDNNNGKVGNIFSSLQNDESTSLVTVPPEDDIIPGPDPRKHTLTASERLDVSLTEHHIKGDGILASVTDLMLPKEEFAAGCNLLQAAARGDLVEMKNHLKTNTHINFRDYDRRTALHVAASEGFLEVVTFLVEHGAKMHRSDRWGGSPLDDAQRHQQTDVIKYLRDHGATTGSMNQSTNLITAAFNGDLEEVQRLAESLGTIEKLNLGDYDKRTALHLAVGEGHTIIAEYLCKAGANVNAEDRWGGRPLDDALRFKHADCIQILESYGARSGSVHETTVTQTISMMDPSMNIDFAEIEMIERIGAGAFGEIYKCRWRGTLVAAKIIKTAKIRKEWLAKHAVFMMNLNPYSDDASPPPALLPASPPDRQCATGMRGRLSTSVVCTTAASGGR